MEWPGAPQWLEAALGTEGLRRTVELAEAAASGELPVAEALRRIHRDVLAPQPPEAHPNAHLRQVAAAIAAAAGSDLATAFSLWCHRIVMEYLAQADPQAPVRRRFLPELARAGRLGSTALAPALRHLLLGVPLPVTATARGGAFTLTGRLPWASNLHPPAFLLVTAAQQSGSGRRIIVAVPGDAPGVQVQPYPRLVALQGTGTSSVQLEEVEVPEEWLITDRFEAFMEQVRRPFLLLQSCCCWGLAARALQEVEPRLAGVNAVFAREFDRLKGRLASVGRRLWQWSDRRRWASLSVRAFVQLRLHAVRLATAAAFLESKVQGGRSYLADTSTARRYMEALFLPVQSPTEAQLVWELARSS